MANKVSQNHAPETLGGAVEVTVAGVVEVSSPLIGRSIIDGLRTKLSTSGQMTEGDFYMDRSRVLLRGHLQLIEVHDQDTIRQRIDGVRDVQNSLENFSGSRFQRFFEARKYRRLSKVTYKIIKNASDRAITDRLMSQMEQATRPPAGGSGSVTGTASMPKNPFTDSHAISTLTDISVDKLDRVEMSAYHIDNSDGAAVVLNMVDQNESVQHVVATFPMESFLGNRTDSGASQSISPEVPAALSLHQEDGTVLRFVTESIPPVSPDQRANEEGEKIHLLNAQRAQHSGVDSELTFRPVETHTLSSFASTEIFDTK